MPKRKRIEETSHGESVAPILGKKIVNALVSPLEAVRNDGVRAVSEIVEKRLKAGDKKIAKDLLPILIRALQDPSWVVRGNATVGVANICKFVEYSDSKKAVKPLIKLLSDQESPVVANSAHTLGIIGAAEAIKPLEAALKKTEYGTWERDIIYNAIKKIKQKTKK